MEVPLRILILEDNPTDTKLIQFELEEAGFIFTSKVVMTEKDFIQELHEFSPDLILSDYDLPQYNGALALAEAKRRLPDTPFILVTGAASEDCAIDMLIQGAKDYVMKTRLQQRLVPAVKRALAEAEEHRTRKQAEEELRKSHRTLDERVKIRTKELEAEIAARKKLENEREHLLAEAEKRAAELDSIISSMATGLIVYDTAGKAIRMNNTAKELVPHEIFFNKTIEERARIIHWETEKGMPFPPEELPVARALLGETIHNVVLAACFPDRKLWISASAAPISTSGGHILGVVTSFIDITKRKLAEEELSRSRQFLSDLIEFSGALICVKNREGRYELVNKKWEEVTGLKRRDTIGRTDEELFPGLVGRQFRLNDLEVMESGSVMEKDEILEDENGKRFFISNKFPQRDDDGKVSGICGVLTEITERKLAEQALRESENLYRTFINATSDMVFLKDEQLRNIVVNKSLAAFFCKPDNEIIGKSDFELMPQFAAEKCKQTDMEALSNKSPVTDEEIIGDQVYETQKFPVNLGSNRDGVGGFIRNITARKRAEEDFRRSHDESPLGVRIVNAKGKTIYVNRAILDIYGFDNINEFNATPAVKRYTSESFNEHQIRKEKRKQGDQILSEYEISIVKKDGEVRHLQVFRKEILWDGERQFQVIYQDITERKEAEKALMEREAKFRTLFESANDAIFLVDQYTFIDCNSKTMDMFGCTKEQIIGQTPDRFSPEVQPDHRKSREKVQEKITAALHGQAQFFEWKHSRYDGTPFDAEVSLNTFNSGGKDYLMAIVRDVTNRKKIEEELKDSERKYRTIFNNAIEGIYQATLDGRFLSINPAFAHMFGYSSPEEMMSEVTNIDEQLYVRQEDRKRLIELIGSSDGIGRNFQTQLRRRDGSIVWVSINSRIVKDEKENKPIIEGICIDVTESKLMEEALKESRRKLAEIIDFLPDAMFVIDSNGKVTAWNRSIESLTGIKAEVMIGKGNYEYAIPFYGERRPILIDLAFSSDDDFLVKSYDTVYHKGSVLSGEVHVPNAFEGKGAYLWSTASRLYNANGEVMGAIQSIRDVTDRKKAAEYQKELEERLQRAEKMEALGTLAGGVAHDLNNVLGIVVGYAEMLMDDLDEANPMREDLMHILEGGNRSAAIVEDLLTLARRGVQTRKIINLNASIMDCQKTPEFEKVLSFNPKVKIKTDLETDILNIIGSSVHLGKTVFNLVSNAVEAMPNGGTLTIKTSNQYLDRPIHGYDHVREGDYVVLTVSDTGEGISEQDIKRIFEPFYTKKVMGKSGTGLGLAVVWGTVKDHNGYIDVQSEIGRGTTFSLYFPVTREEMAKAETAIPLSEYIGNDESVIVIDDIKEQRELAAKMLGKLNYKVKTFSSGEEAIEYLKTGKADILVLDMIMDPGIDGLDTYKAILRIHPKQKAIIVSGFSESERVQEAKVLGAGEYLRKPYVQEKLGLALRQELDRK
ncbi:MAG: Sensor histidine kinase RcsC [Syntrophus sp. SKADARSKE-3]|nr:Sensor histidine kinase RcsC [Syntrophus sp. SKADARSKE-3]